MTGSRDNGLSSRFLRGLARSADRPAIKLGREIITYRRAHELALRWAASLLDAIPAENSGRPPVVGVLAEKNLTSYVGILAAVYAGGTVVPLNPAFPAARTMHMLHLSGARVVLADERGRAVIEALAGDGAVTGVAPPVVLVPDPSGRIGDAVPALEHPRPTAAADPAYMLFTSGSTGTPKGVPITQGNLASYFDTLDQRYDFGPDDVFTQTFDLNFDCAMFDLFCAWGAGAVVAPLPPTAYLDLPMHLAELGVTVWFSTPSTISLVRRMGQLQPAVMPGLRWSFFAGEALRCQDAADWHAAAPNCLLENIYGPTELTVTITGHRWDPISSPARSVNGLVPIGAVHPGHDHVLVDDDDRPVENEGELLITGPQMAPGYLDPADNQGRFVHRDGRTWYRTGDRVRRLDRGELVYLGRLDAQVQVQGWRVELAEIDHALRAQPGVEDAATVALPTPDGIELVVFYTGRPSTPRQLSRALREILPHGMLPNRYEHLADLPLNSNRKVDRAALAQQARRTVQPVRK